MPSNKFKTRFPPARIKKIMQTDEEVGKIAAPVPVIVSKSVELFTEVLLDKCGAIATARGAKTLSIDHIKQCVDQEPKFDFLREIVREAAAKAIGKNGEDGQPGYGPATSGGEGENGSERQNHRIKTDTVSPSAPGVLASPRTHSSEFSFATNYSGGSFLEQQSGKRLSTAEIKSEPAALHPRDFQGSRHQEAEGSGIETWNHHEGHEDVQPSTSRGLTRSESTGSRKDIHGGLQRHRGSASGAPACSPSSRKTASLQNACTVARGESEPTSPQTAPSSPFLYGPSSSAVFPVPVMNYPSMVPPSHYAIPEYNPQLMHMMNLMQPQYSSQCYDSSDPGCPPSPYYTEDPYHREQRVSTYPSPRDYPGAAMPVIRPAHGAQDLSRKRPLDLTEPGSFYSSYHGSNGTVGN